jgi:hypothetical protein
VLRQALADFARRDQQDALGALEGRSQGGGACVVRTAATIFPAGTPRCSSWAMTRRPSWPVAPVTTIMRNFSEGVDG